MAKMKFKKQPISVFAGMFAMPNALNFENYVRVFQEFKIRQYNYADMLYNSLWELALKLFVSMLSSVCFAYAVARYRFPGRDFLYGLVIFAKTIPIIGNGPAEFKLISSLGMVNNPALIWLAWAGGFDFAFIVLYGTFKGISRTYSEAAKIDGAGHFTILFKVMIPQVLGVWGALFIMQFITMWNDATASMMYFPDWPTLATGLFEYESKMIRKVNMPVYFAGLMIAMVPVLTLFLLFQETIMEKVNLGGLKG